MVIGGGITGLTAAYLLRAAGKSVVVLERGRCAMVDSGHTSAHLTMVTDARLTELERRFGKTHAQAAWDAGLAAIGQIDEIVRSNAISCGFDWVPGYLHVPLALQSPGADAKNDADVASLQADAKLAVELGFDATFVDSVPTVDRPGIRFGDQARFHPRAYLAGLATALRDAGVHIYEHSGAEEFCADPLSVTANGVTIPCDDIVVATHNPVVGVMGMTSASLFQTKLALYTSYVVAGRVARGTVPDALFWDTATAYNYLRLEPHRDFDLVIFGGQDHKTGQADDTAACFEKLEVALASRVPGVTVTHRWSGQVIETPDALPYIGKMADHQYAATGFGGNGLTFGTLGGMMMADAILERANPWSDLFDTSRRAITRGLVDYVKENSDYPYYLLRDRFAGGDGSLRSIKRGSGKVVERHGQRVAAHRREDGSVVLRSAVCTHLGCTVAWNTAERTWDCPCHGSRFSPEGDVISGPAESPLEKIE